MTGGSKQLRVFRAAIAEGKTLSTACVLSGLSREEGRLTLQADAADPPGPECFEPIGEEKGTDMAKAAAAGAGKSTPVNGEVPQPDFEKAIKILKGDLNPLTEQGAKIRGDQAAGWKAIEKDCHCNKKGMKFVHSLMRMDPEIRDDVLRTLYGGMKAAGIGISKDLVDRLSETGEAPTMPIVESNRPELMSVN